MNKQLLKSLVLMSAVVTTNTFAQTVLEANAANTGHLVKTENTRTGKTNFLSVERGYSIQLPATFKATALSKEQIARSYLSIYGNQFGLSNTATELVSEKVKPASNSRTIVRFSQTYKGIPVYGSDLIVGIAQDNSLLSINGEVASAINTTTVPTVTQNQSQNIALQLMANASKDSASPLKVENAQLVIFNAAIVDMPGDSSNILAWKCQVKGDGKEGPIDELVFINANNGKVLYHFNQIADAKNRSTYSYQNTTTSTVLKRSEGQAAIGEVDVDNAHDFAGDTYNFYKSKHSRNSINNAGLPLISNVHYSTNYCNAFWDGSVMTYGDGCFIVTDDVVAHELTHGVTQYESNLIYSGQSGAINEAFSDIWGEFVDLTNGKMTDTKAVRWLMGEDTSIGAIRNMKNPPLQNQPDRTRSSLYYCGVADNGGVHTNSGVANKAAYLLTDGGTFRGYTITGLGLTNTANLFYEVQANILTSNAKYPALFNALNQACTNLAYTTAQCQQVTNTGLATQMNQNPCPSLPCSTQAISAGTTVNGSLGATDCFSNKRSGSYADNYTFQAMAGVQYTIDLNSSSFDAYLYLLDGSTVLAFNDDFSGTNSRIVYTPTVSKTLTIHATSYFSSATGAYSVSLSAL